SQAQLTASLIAAWSPSQLDSLKRLLAVVEAKGRAGKLAALVWPAEQDDQAQAAVAALVAKGGSRRANGVLLAAADLFDAAAALAAAGVEPVTVSRPDYVFESRSRVLDDLTARLKGNI
ncbi:MAG: ATP phosphoribosyltransferase, partial [Alphaproteobacteria bacterium]|nr:ATP phosphoribosyltransferase [Alphaproteobacteria bacterium]